MSETTQPTAQFMISDRISADPAICGDRPCIAGTRMRVMDIVSMLAAGDSVDEMLTDFDHIDRGDIRAALLYAADAVSQRVVMAA